MDPEKEQDTQPRRQKTEADTNVGGVACSLDDPNRFEDEDWNFPEIGPWTDRKEELTFEDWVEDDEVEAAKDVKAIAAGKWIEIRNM